MCEKNCQGYNGNRKADQDCESTVELYETSDREMTNSQLSHIYEAPSYGSIRLISYLLFVAGFSYYCIFPVIFLSVFADSPISEVLLKRWTDSYMDKMYLYLIFFYLISFSSGYYLSSRNGVIKPKKERGTGIGNLSVFITICYVGLFIFIVDVREIMSPSGYLDGYDVAHKGQLSTLYLVSIWWFVYLKTTAVNANIQTKLMLVIVFITGLNLLTLGSRLSVVSGMITLFIFYFYFVKKMRLQDSGAQKHVPIRWIVIIFITGILMSSIGLLREGTGISWEGIISIFAAEPLFIYASIPAYFSNNSLPLFAIPLDLFSGIVGAIPSFLFSEKGAFFAKYAMINEDFVSGFGGSHHVVTLIANFGLIGFPVAAFFEGAWFGMLVRRVHISAFFRAVTLSSIAMLPFIMFREGLSTPVKLLFFNFLLVPYIMLNVLFSIKRLVSRARMVEIPRLQPKKGYELPHAKL